MPAYTGAVDDLQSLVSNDPSAVVPDQYKLLKDIGEWVTNVGYPGFANPPVGEVLGARPDFKNVFCCCHSTAHSR